MRGPRPLLLGGALAGALLVAGGGALAGVGTDGARAPGSVSLPTIPTSPTATPGPSGASASIDADGGGATAAAAGSSAAGGATTAPAAKAQPVSTKVEKVGTDVLSAWAPLRHATAAYAKPSTRSRVVAKIDGKTPEGTTSNVLILERQWVKGALWLHVRLPVLPNGTTGWMRRTDLGGIESVDTSVVIDRKALRLTLYQDGKAVFEAPVGVGKGDTPTPAGSFYVRNKLTGYASPTYGPLAFGLSARSAVLTDWPAGGYIGIHGTDEPDILPGQVSHGCVRMRNDDILQLAKLLVPGTPVRIV